MVFYKKYMLFIAIATAFFNTAHGQDLPQFANRMEGFVPQNMQIIDSIRGDLNKDGIPDLAFVLENTKECITQEDDFCPHPRTLAIAFANADNSGYTLVLQADRFILNRYSPQEDEPFEGLSVKRRSLFINFRLWTAAGSWYAGTETYVFRWQNQQFELIGQASDTYHRATGKRVKQSVNYSTQKNHTAETSISLDHDIKSKTESFQLDRPYVLGRNTERADFVAPKSRNLESLF